MAKIKYTCKKCNWTASITEHWADLKPKRCGNKKCRQGFIKQPELLNIEAPKKENKNVEPLIPEYEGHYTQT